MSHKSEYLEKEKAEWLNANFKDHKAELLIFLTPVVIINWQKPGTWNYGCRFIIHRRWLTVVGDIGEATYEWGQDLTLEFLAGLDFGYFHSKCRASETGKDYDEWDYHLAKKVADSRIAELESAALTDDESQTDADEIEWLRHLEATGYSKDAFMKSAEEVYDATGDAELASSIADMGEVPASRCIGHFVGLQMAIAQLSQGKGTP